MTSICVELNTFRRSRIYESCQIVFIKKMRYVRCNNEIRNVGRHIWSPNFWQVENGCCFRNNCNQRNDTMKPTGQCILEEFRTLIICFSSVNSIIKRSLWELRAKGWVLRLIVDHRIFLIVFHYFKNSWYMWKDDNIRNPKRKYG